MTEDERQQRSDNRNAYIGLTDFIGQENQNRLEEMETLVEWLPKDAIPELKKEIEAFVRETTKYADPEYGIDIEKIMAHVQRKFDGKKGHAEPYEDEGTQAAYDNYVAGLTEADRQQLSARIMRIQMAPAHEVPSLVVGLEEFVRNEIKDTIEVNTVMGHITSKIKSGREPVALDVSQGFEEKDFAFNR